MSNRNLLLHVIIDPNNNTLFDSHFSTQADLWFYDDYTYELRIKETDENIASGRYWRLGDNVVEYLPAPGQGYLPFWGESSSAYKAIKDIYDRIVIAMLEANLLR